MQATVFRSTDLTRSDSAWQNLFREFWPAYKNWFVSKKGALINMTELKLAQQKFAEHMPELWPTYQKLVKLADNDPTAAQFLTMYRPPAYLINCSQAVLTDDAPILMRNYDLSPDLSENTVSMSNWLGQQVSATNECLWGVDDGMNEAGLAVSLTFGGSQTVGDGFGIPIIITYILHTCTSTAQAIEVLRRIPTHMAYNVTMVDKTGAHATVMVAPNQAAQVTTQRAITNHQAQVTWAAQASFSKTVERKDFLDEFLAQPRTRDELLDAFLTAPLRSTNFAAHFGTVFTAVYQPLSGEMTYAWPNQRWTHRFEDFKNDSISVQLDGETSTDWASITDWVAFGEQMWRKWVYPTVQAAAQFQRLPRSIHH